MNKNLNHFCTLEKSINHCSYFDGDQYCNNPDTSCGMLHIEKKKKEYIREERWYEKYYRH